MNSPLHFSKNASGKKFSSACFASGVNRPERRAASRVWARRRENRVGVICYPDHLGTPRAITTSDAANTKVWEWKNDDPFGNNLPNENPSALGTFNYNNRFPGQYFDQETNTSYNYFRDYDPSLGRYVQSDPKGLAAGVNTFAYASGSPIRHFDIFGLDCISMGWFPNIPGDSSQEFKSENIDRLAQPNRSRYAPKVEWGKMNCKLTDFLPPFGPNPQIKPPKLPMCLPEIKLQTWDLWELGIRQFSRSYQDGFDLVVCDPAGCGDDGIKKTPKRKYGDWTKDFDRYSGTEWRFRGGSDVKDE